MPNNVNVFKTIGGVRALVYLAVDLILDKLQNLMKQNSIVCVMTALNGHISRMPAILSAMKSAMLILIMDLPQQIAIALQDMPGIKKQKHAT